METDRRTADLSPSPRHLRKRRFRADLRSTSMGGYEAAEKPPRNARATPAPSPDMPRPTIGLKSRTSGRKASPRRKRLIALVVVIFVAISIPVLALTLVFGR